MHLKAIIFDFDGVLVNSLNETALTSYNTVTGELATSFDKVPEGYLKLYLVNRPHVQPAADFYILAKWCLDNYKTNPNHLLSSSEYKELIVKTEIPFQERARLFFGARKRFWENDLKKWLSLHSVYEPIFSEVKK